MFRHSKNDLEYLQRSVFLLIQESQEGDASTNTNKQKTQGRDFPRVISLGNVRCAAQIGAGMLLCG